MRSRYVNASREDDVLLDQNLLEHISNSPLYIRAHSKVGSENRLVVRWPVALRQRRFAVIQARSFLFGTCRLFSTRPSTTTRASCPT